MLLAVVLTLLSQTDAGIRSPDGGLPPVGLTCLPTWYAGKVKWSVDAGWGLQLDNGVFVAWDTGTTADANDPESEEIPDLAASTGSACHEGQVSLSPVLRAMGVPPEIGKGAVRLSVGRFTTEEEVDRAADMLIRFSRENTDNLQGTSAK